MPRPSQLSHKRGFRLRVPQPTADPDIGLLHSSLIALVRDLKQDEMTLRQLAVLSALSSTCGPYKVREIAATLGVAKSAISRAVDKLEMRGLAVRTPDPIDGRSVLVFATSEGFQLAKSISVAFRS